MTSSRMGGRAGAGEPAASSPTGAVVAVLTKRGRFLVAEPLFDRDRSGPPRTRGPARLTLTPGRSGRGGGVGADVGDLVLVQASARRSGARVIGVLGRPDVARDVIAGLMLDRGCSRGFDAAVEREAREAAERVWHAREQRRDLRGLPTFTIDPISARDFDDAISAEVLADGTVRVWVHIADVAAHVPEGSLVDREARMRATSVYVPGAVEPMLPHALSDDACSLRPGAERPAVTVELELAGARLARAAFYRSIVRSDERLDYERVDRIFAGRESAAEPWQAPLLAARGAAAALRAERERRGALVIDSEEPEFAFDAAGNISEIRARVQTESHRLIEHLMIAANEAVAGLLAQRGVPCLYRVHERPEPERIERLADQLASLEVPTPPLPKPMSASQAAELVGPISRRIDDHVRRTGRGRVALGLLLLRSLKQAFYSPANIGHAGLRSACYCHFTSPIRRYPDLVCHRALLSSVGGPESPPRAGELLELGAWASQRERDAMMVERDADDIARCFALERVLYEEGWDRSFSGEVVTLISAGVFVAFGGGPGPAAHGRPANGDVGGGPDTTGDLRVDRGRAGAGAGGPPAPLYSGMLPIGRLRSASEPPARPSGGRSRVGRGRAASTQAREWWELNEQSTILHGERTGATLRLGDPIEVRVLGVDPVRGRADLEAVGGR